MFFKKQKNIVKKLLYKGAIIYADFLLENLKENFKEKNIPLNYHNVEVLIIQTKKEFEKLYYEKI